MFPPLIGTNQRPRVTLMDGATHAKHTETRSAGHGHVRLRTSPAPC